MSLLKEALIDFKNLSNKTKSISNAVSNVGLESKGFNLQTSPNNLVKWSREQEAVLESNQKNLTVVALAGSGKTQTALEYIKRRHFQKWIYLVFNRSMKDEVQNQVANMKATTLHAHVFPKYGLPLQHKLNKEIDYQKILQISQAKPPFILEKLYAQLLWETVANFAQSSDAIIALQHIPNQLWWKVLKHPANNTTAQQIVKEAYYLWEACIDARNSIPTSHDHYLKLAQLSGMEWNSPTLLDEAQDASACMLSLIENQSNPWVMMGDPYQTLYTFRGAVGNFSKEKNPLALTGSFRFGENIAYLANLALEQLQSEWFLQGKSSCKGFIKEENKPNKGDVILTHTNEKALWWGLQLMEKGHSVHWLGSMHSTLETLKELDYWRQGNKPNRLEWSSFTFKEYENWLERNPDHPDATNFKWLEKINPNHVVWKDLQKSKEKENPDFMIGTTHQSKGLTFKKVFIDMELFESCKTASSYSDKIEAWKRMYVALTRSSQSIHSMEGSLELLKSIPQIANQTLNCFDED